MLCSDDKHPDELLLGHINRLVARAIAAGTDPMNAIRAASLNPIRHYGLSLGLLQVGDSADFILTDDLREFGVRASYLAGREVARDGQSLLPDSTTETINNFAAPPIAREALAVRAESDRIRVIEATDGQLITGGGITEATVREGLAIADPDRDVLKLVVVNRYQEAPPAVAFVRGFGLRRGALASSVAHDSHNVVAVGASDDELCGAINAVIANRGGLSVQVGSQLQVLPLPVAGLMATGTCEAVAADYSRLDRQAKELGSTLRAPYMTLSFMALLVIPSLKLSDRGLFDGDRFEFVPLFV
jgi:adenine deaminase